VTPRWGAIADDFTGACDLAGQVVASGATAVVVTSVEAIATAPDAEWIVVAQKSRTAPASEAVFLATMAALALRARGTQGIYQKYCSTFDSTDAGNIGPVAEALLAATGASVSIGTPASPSIERTVYRGHLFVGDHLLSESSLRNHPLTPMRDPDVVRVLSRQTTAPVTSAPRGLSARELAHTLHGASATHVLLDAINEEDLDSAAEAVGIAHGSGLRMVLGGGAGLAAALARTEARGSASESIFLSALAAVAPSQELVLAGSCSERTLEQIAHFPGPTLGRDR
jgi:3-dehydrotetronate 4-kinase